MNLKLAVSQVQEVVLALLNLTHPLLRLHARHRLRQLFLQRGPLRLLGTPQLGLGRKLRLLREDLLLFGEIEVHEVVAAPRARVPSLQGAG